MITEYSCIGCTSRLLIPDGRCPLRPDKCPVHKAVITCKCGTRVWYPAGIPIRMCGSCATKEVRKALMHRMLGSIQTEIGTFTKDENVVSITSRR